MEQAIVVLGNPVDGLRFFGPFEDTDQAIEWAEQHAPSYDNWWTARLRGKDDT